MSHLWDQVLEGIHDLGALGLLVVGETTGDDDDSGEHDTKVQLQEARGNVSQFISGGY